MKNVRFLDPDAAVQLLETRLGPLRARLRLGIEREHEAQAFGQGLTFLHLENVPLTQVMIEAVLRVTGAYSRGKDGNEAQRCVCIRGLPKLSTASRSCVCMRT